MKWTLAPRQSTILREFHLVEGNSTKEVLRYDPVHRTARINFRGRQRLFFLEPSGFWGQDIMFRNEYGLEMGKLTIHKKHESGGSLLMEHRKFNYVIKEGELVTLALFEKGAEHPLITCNFEATQNAGMGTAPSDDMVHRYACLLLGLAWYLFIPIPSEIEIPAEPAKALASSFPTPVKKETAS